jgi:hypothetical protein
MNYYKVTGQTVKFMSAFFSRVLLFKNIAQMKVKASQVCMQPSDTMKIFMKDGSIYELAFKKVKDKH